ncbi:Retrotransposon protein, Ty3-gypsy subclass [Gossypium australe]|uniref:Retrotransposon protein, Ty3-gypsy subclass n=1 Tax=Gossypium australe TaxID=47621 RepID=A0A5B6UV45_9ROSI|nr:Retrotransposon protein, Ty3-gypsy subclass [Gossypium australe]
MQCTLEATGYIKTITSCIVSCYKICGKVLNLSKGESRVSVSIKTTATTQNSRAKVGENHHGFCVRIATNFDKERCYLGDYGSLYQQCTFLSCLHKLHFAKAYRDIHRRDNPRFTSIFWKSLQEALGSKLKLSTAYHLQTYGQSERVIHVLEDMFQSYVLEFPKTCERY